MISFGYLSKKQADELGMEVRAKAAGPDTVRVELEFKLEGKLKNFREAKAHNRVELRVSEGKKKSLMTATLREDRSKPGRISVSFTSDRSQLDMISLWVVQYVAGHARVLRMKDFIDLDNIAVPKEPRDPAPAEQNRGKAGAGPATAGE